MRRCPSRRPSCSCPMSCPSPSVRLCAFAAHIFGAVLAAQQMHCSSHRSHTFGAKPEEAMHVTSPTAPCTTCTRCMDASGDGLNNNSWRAPTQAACTAWRCPAGSRCCRGWYELCFTGFHCPAGGLHSVAVSGSEQVLSWAGQQSLRQQPCCLETSKASNIRDCASLISLSCRRAA